MAKKTVLVSILFETDEGYDRLPNNDEIIAALAHSTAAEALGDAVAGCDCYCRVNMELVEPYSPDINRDIMPNPDNRWQDHPVYRRSDWNHEAGDDDTLLGYWEWVAHKLEEEEHDVIPEGDEERNERPGQ